MNLKQVISGALLGGAFVAASASPTVIYDSLGPAAPNVVSQGYEATSTSEFGDRIGFAGTARALDTVTVRMSSWALQTDFGGAGAGYQHNLTFNIYGVGSGASPGALLATKTIDAFVPYRPAADGCDGAGGGYTGSDGRCYHGLAFDVSFDFASLGILLPNAVVFGLAFNTADFGANPMGVNGPYNSLNFGVSGGASVGTDVNPDGVFWNTSHGDFLANPGNAGQFMEDTNWSGNVPAVQFTADDAGTVPEPASLALVGLALAGLGYARRRKA